MKLFRRLLIFVILLSSTMSAQTWEEINTPDLGSIFHTTFTNNGELLAFAKHRGVYLSSDTGKTWEVIGTDFSAGTAGVINGVITAPNGDIFLFDAGVYRSTDDGRSWEYFKNGLNSGTPRQMVTLSSGEVFLAYDVGWGIDGVFTLDTSGTWISVNNNIGDKNVRGIAVLNDTLYAGTEGGVFRSADKGATWEATALTQKAEFVYACNTGTLYATKFRTLYKSTDRGATWETLTCPSNVLWLEPESGAIYSQKYGAVSVSTDEGAAWNSANLNFPSSAGLNDLKCYGKLFIASTTLGVFVSEDGGTTWNSGWTGMHAFKINKSIIDDNGNYYLGLEQFGIFRSTDAGLSWTKINDEVFPTAIEIDQSGNLYLTTQLGKLYQSTDNGDSWTQIFSINFGITGIQFNSAGDIFLGTGQYNVYRSTDGGSNFTQLAVSGNVIGCLKVFSNDAIIVKSNEGIFKSTDNGDSWTESGSGVPKSAKPAEFAESPNGTYWAACPGLGVYSSNDGGANWTVSLETTSFNYEAFSNLAVTGKGIVYAGTTNGFGVFRTTDNGASWSQSFTPAPDKSVYSLSVDKDDNIYAGSLGAGLFKYHETAEVTDVNDAEIPVAFYLSQNYPNPFNPSTAIRYSIPSPGFLKGTQVFVRLEIFNALGEKVETLVNETKLPGNYSVVFNAARLTSGVYFYRLTAGRKISTKKMTLLR